MKFNVKINGSHAIYETIYPLFVNSGYYLENDCSTLADILKIYDNINNLDDVVEYLRHL